MTREAATISLHYELPLVFPSRSWYFINRSDFSPLYQFSLISMEPSGLSLLSCKTHLPLKFGYSCNMNSKAGTKRKRNMQLPDSSNSLKSSATSCKRRKRMEKWHARSNFHEFHLLQLLRSIRTEEFTDIGNAYNDVFWVDFTRIFNYIIQDDNDGHHEFHPFDYEEIIQASKTLREKAHKYKHKDDLPNKELLKACYLKCGSCSSLPVHPSGKSVSRRRTGAGPSGAGPSFRSVSRLSRASRPSINDLPISCTPDGELARKKLLDLWQSKDADGRRFLATEYLQRAAEYLDAKLLNSLLFNELRSDAERLCFIINMVKGPIAQ